jgi:hypothetical protein
MSGFALKRETREQVTYTLPSELVSQIAERASATHVSVDAAVAVLLKKGLASQGQKEQEIERLYSQFHESTDEHDRSAIFEELGKSVFGK